MGRGRAKAKQTKVARKLKYSGPDTDFERLQAELASDPGSTSNDAADVNEPDENDPYAKYAEDDYESDNK